MMFLKACALLILVIWPLAHSEAITYLDGSYRIPENWSYKEIPETGFELPLPINSKIDSDTTIISSHAIYDDKKPQIDYFRFFFQKVADVHSFDEYANHLCYTFSGKQDGGGPFGRNPSYEMKGRKEINGISIFEIHEDCSLDSITAYVLIYGNEVYRVGVFDDGMRMNFDLIYSALFNIRPINTQLRALQYLVNNGIVSGYPDGTFRTYNLINRAEFTKIVVGALPPSLTLPPVEEGNSPSSLERGLGGEVDAQNCFPDVPNDAWFASYVCTAKEQGIIGGHPDGTFRPADTINTAEAAKIVVEAFDLDISFFDRAQDDSMEWYVPYMNVLKDIEALPLSAQKSDHLLTRGEMVEIIFNVMTRVK